MATPGQLVQTMADVLGIPAATVAQYDRQLAEAGLRTTGGRGTSAAKVTAVDAANLLIAVLGSPVSGPSIKAAKQTCDMFGSLLVRSNFSDTGRFRRFGLRSLATLPKKHTFRDALAVLIEGASHGELFRIATGNDVLLETDICFSVTLESMDHWAEIMADGSVGQQEWKKMGRLVYNLPEPDMEARNLPKPDLAQQRTISFRTLRLLSNLIAIGRG